MERVEVRAGWPTRVGLSLLIGIAYVSALALFVVLLLSPEEKPDLLAPVFTIFALIVLVGMSVAWLRYIHSPWLILDESGIGWNCLLALGPRPRGLRLSDHP